MNKKCNKCKLNTDMAQIPYIEHKNRMYKAYRREMILKVLLVVSNLLWIANAFLNVTMR